MAKQPRLVVVGSFVADLIFRIPRMPKRGETLVGSDFNRFLGGKGVNQAVAAARLGAKVTVTGRVGDDVFGEEQIAKMKEEGIDPKGVVKDPKVPTGCSSVLLEEDGSNRICFIPGANQAMQASDVDAVVDAIQEADAIVCQFEVPDEVIVRVAELASKYNVRFIWNPAPAREVPDNVLPAVHVLTPNESEASYLSGIEVTDVESAKQAAHKIQELGVTNVVITMGHHGVLVVNDTEEFIPACKVNVVDTVGAGDAFTGALAFSLASGLDLLEAARFANAVAALSVTRNGALPAMPTLQEVKDYFGESVWKGDETA